MSDPDASRPQSGRLAELRSSARGWHSIQLAVLGFIGLCGVLQRGSTAPSWLQVLAAILAVGALGLACLATFLIGGVAWPLYGWSGAAQSNPEPDELARASRRLTTGLILTFLAVAMLALATAVGWWPRGAETAGQVQAQSADGQSWCGQLAQARPGALRLDTADGPVEVALSTLASVRPVDTCG